MNWNSAVRNNDICISCLQLKWQCKCVIFINSKQKTKWLVAILYTFVIISLTFSCERNSQFLLLWFQFVLYYHQQNFPPVMVLILLCLLPGNNMVSTFKVYTSCQFSQWNLWVKKKKIFLICQIYSYCLSSKIFSIYHFGVSLYSRSFNSLFKRV